MTLKVINYYKKIAINQWNLGKLALYLVAY